MFTGIVEQTVPVAAVSDHDAGRRLWLAVAWGDEKVGHSVAVNGCCLTIAAIGPERLGFDVVPETLACTNLGQLEVGDHVHVERALRAGDRVDGHFVLGHVDGMAQLVACRGDERETRLRLRVSDLLSAYVVPKGSVCLDGVSLTVAVLEGNEFEVALIPTTLAKTALAERPIGWPMNFEADLIVKTIAATIGRMSPPRA